MAKSTMFFSMLRYNDKGSVVITAFTNAGIECKQYQSNINKTNPDYDNFVRNGLKRPVVEVDSIMLTPENIAEENPKAGLRSGFKEGTIFKKLGDSENEYVMNYLKPVKDADKSMARAFYDANGRIYVRYPNEFAKNMVDSAGVTESILAAACIELKRSIAPQDMIFGVLEGNEDLTEFDDLII